MSLKSIRLELARDAAHPEGNPEHGYEFRAPLSTDGHLDEAVWNRAKPFCTVRHFGFGDDEHGLLMRSKGGHWFFSYAIGADDDEPLFKLSSHRFAPGEYVTITEHDHVGRTFKVVSVKDWTPTQH